MLVETTQIVQYFHNPPKAIKYVHSLLYITNWNELYIYNWNFLLSSLCVGNTVLFFIFLTYVSPPQEGQSMGPVIKEAHIG